MGTRYQMDARASRPPIPPLPAPLHGSRASPPCPSTSLLSPPCSGHPSTPLQPCKHLRAGASRPAAGAAKASSPAPPSPVGGRSARGVPTPWPPCWGPGPLDWTWAPHPTVGSSAQVGQGGLEAEPVPALMGVRRELRKSLLKQLTQESSRGPLGTRQRPQSRQGPSAGRPTVLAWPLGGQGPICTPGLAPTVEAPKRLRSSICDQDPEAPALSRAFLAPAVAQPWAAHARRAGPRLPCTYSSVASGTPSPAWELTPRAGSETVAAVRRVITAA